jgi:hypothetical protein
VPELNTGGELTRACAVDVEALNWPAHPASVAAIKNTEIAAALFALPWFVVLFRYSFVVMLIIFIQADLYTTP